MREVAQVEAQIVNRPALIGAIIKTVSLLSALLLRVAMPRCDNHSNKTDNPILGRYELTGRDSSGQLAFTGTILFVSVEQNLLKGQCKILSEHDAPHAWFEKDGSCEALMDGKKIDLDSLHILTPRGFSWKVSLMVSRYVAFGGGTASSLANHWENSRRLRKCKADLLHRPSAPVHNS